MDSEPFPGVIKFSAFPACQNGGKVGSKCAEQSLAHAKPLSSKMQGMEVRS